ncbi:mitogen-activated protein kinase kinase kinase 17 [Cajanus cajan]|uniref:Mitogen-activated protein kinase kinase kinase A n=1 Tax=Cajanus cajan TaxID=3821 RepID=A0A151RT29_CAJCA|nr:mitogen-activated protein kinase kinase kinase 17 [Cajanus cajan]KYP45708.1 Mitogen-activated protein kinase kinase kinase A [Cajanus cajan]
MASWVRGKCVGKGAFGVVNIALSKHDARVFAVKSVDIKAGRQGQVEALENEIAILRRLASPHVVAYLGDDVTCEEGFFIRNLHLEYMPGGTVADLAHADVDQRLLRRYAWCIVSALRDVHARGFVHCDVKGRNVLLAADGSVAKLADFGAAVAAEAAVMPRGSPMWMAPEVVRRERQGPEADVWSLGCTVVEMVTGKPAWEDRGVDTLSRIGYSDELPEFPSKLSELGRDFLDKCLRREPRERWSCDRLLQHPFLLPCDRVLESSPRCVLDWVDSEFAESDNEREHEEEKIMLNFNRKENSVKNRISKLAAGSRVNWESEGWVVVREIEWNGEPWTSGTERACDDGVSWNKERVNWDFFNAVGTGLEYCDFGGVKWEMQKFDNRGEGGGGWNRYGWQKLDRSRGILSIYRLSCKNFMSSYMLFLMYFNILCLSITFVVYLLLHVTQIIKGAFGEKMNGKGKGFANCN